MGKLGRGSKMSAGEVVSPKDWREARRIRAWELKQKGWKQADIAEALGVSDGAVSQWLKAARENGILALRSRCGGGPKQRISDEQLRTLPTLLDNGPEYFGFEYSTWTCARVAELIKHEFGVCYTAVHVGRLLKKLGWKQNRKS